jgi:hypothetical protein
VTDISEAECLAFITREQIRLVTAQADLLEMASLRDRRRRKTVCVIDWSTGQAAYSDNVIPFPIHRRRA